MRVKADSCPDDVFDGVGTQLTRVNQPFFGGIASAVNPQNATCTVELNWNAATTVCDGPLRYVVYRDTTSPVSTSPANLVAGGLTGTSYTDTFALANEQTYSYLVRAQDVSTGQFDTNGIEASAAPDGPGNGLNSVALQDFEDPVSFAQWTVTTGPGPHSCGEWALANNGGQRPTGSSGDFMVADALCAPLAPRTSTTIESTPVDLDLPNIIGARLEADVRYGYFNGDDASIEVWDGSQWVVLWTDPNANFNQHLSFDVSTHAVGNSDFRVRFDYQNANADRFFAVDNVDVLADRVVACSTAALGPPSVKETSLLASRSGADIDVSWDAASCPATDYNLLYGDLANVGSYTLQGSECSIGTSGSFNWGGVPAGDLYFLVVGADGAGTESSWGRDSGLGERNGAADSGECGVSVKDPTHVCL